MTALAAGAGPHRRTVPRPTASGLASGVVLTALLGLGVAAYASAGLSVQDMIDDWPNAANFLNRAVPLDFPPLTEVLWLSALTLAIVICGTVLAALISLPVAYWAAANTSPNRVTRVLGRFTGVAARAAPDAVLAMIFAMVLGFGALPGILALGLHSVGMISKLFADAIEQIDEGPRTALRAGGASRSQEFWSGVFPQVLPSFVATVLHRNDINLRASVILGFVNVAGLGFALSYALQTLNYRRAMALAVVMFVLCVVMEIVSSAIRASLLGVRPTGRGLGDRVVRGASRLGSRVPPTVGPAVAPTHTEPDHRRRPWTADRVRNLVFAWGAVAVVAASAVVSARQGGNLVNVWQNAVVQWNRLWPPGFTETGRARIGQALVETVSIALAATLFAAVLSVLIGSFAARNVAPTPGVRGLSRLVLVVIRGIPELILAIVFLVMFGFGQGPAVLALGIGGIGLLGKLLADSIEEVDPGPERALRAAGATRMQIYTAATFAQATPAFIGHVLYMLDTNIRAATILGFVGAGGVGYMLLTSTTSQQHQLLAILLCLAAIVFALELLSMLLRRLTR